MTELEPVVLFDGTLAEVHGAEACRGGAGCPFHGPSDHHMTTWPLSIRFDVPGTPVERLCEHGLTHPDPDSVNFLVNRATQLGLGESVRLGYTLKLLLHQCDECCEYREKEESDDDR